MNYLNTRPLLYGLERLPVKEKMDITGDYPSWVTRRLATGDIDIGLIPVADFKTLPTGILVGHHCIATDGEAASVCLFSEQPIELVQKVILDYQSSTSVALVYVLFHRFWRKEVTFEAAADDSYLERIQGTTAGLIIGDRALKARSKFPYVYDLGLAWKQMTGLPFVFAVWASIKPLPADFTEAFDQANGWGLEKMNDIVKGLDNNTGYDLLQYYTENMSYRLDDIKRESIRLFWKEMDALP